MGGPRSCHQGGKSHKEVIEPPVRLFVDINNRRIRENIVKLKQVSYHSRNVLTVLTRKN